MLGSIRSVGRLHMLLTASGVLAKAGKDAGLRNVACMLYTIEEEGYPGTRAPGANM